MLLLLLISEAGEAGGGRDSACEQSGARSATGKLCNSPEAARPPGEEGSESR